MLHAHTRILTHTLYLIDESNSITFPFNTVNSVVSNCVWLLVVRYMARQDYRQIYIAFQQEFVILYCIELLNIWSYHFLMASQYPLANSHIVQPKSYLLYNNGQHLCNMYRWFAITRLPRQLGVVHSQMKWWWGNRTIIYQPSCGTSVGRPMSDAPLITEMLYHHLQSWATWQAFYIPRTIFRWKSVFLSSVSL